MDYRSNVLRIPSATESQTDPAQYMIRHNRKQYNLCGHFSVAYCTQDEAHTDNIDDFLNYWEAKELKWYQSAFPSWLGRVTGVSDLLTMLSDYEDVKTLPLANTVSNPYVYEDMLREYQAIIAVQVDAIGYLVGRGIPHWVVLDGIEVFTKDHALVKVYNSYNNCERPFEWRTIMNSAGAYRGGLWVGR